MLAKSSDMKDTSSSTAGVDFGGIHGEAHAPVQGHVKASGAHRSMSSTSSSSHDASVSKFSPHSNTGSKSKEVNLEAKGAVKSRGNCLCVKSTKQSFKHKHPETCSIRAGLQCCDGASRYPIYHPHVFKGQTSYTNIHSTIYVLQSDYNAGTYPKWPGKVVIHDSNEALEVHKNTKHLVSKSSSNSVDDVEIRTGMKKKASISRSHSARMVKNVTSSFSSCSSSEEVHEEVVMHQEVREIEHKLMTSSSSSSSESVVDLAPTPAQAITSRSFSRSASSVSKAASLKKNNYYGSYHDGLYEEKTTAKPQSGGILGCCQKKNSANRSSELPPATKANLNDRTNAERILATKSKTKTKKTGGRTNICCQPKTDSVSEIQTPKTKGHTLLKRASSSSSTSSDIDAAHIQTTHVQTSRSYSQTKLAAVKSTASDVDMYDGIQWTMEKKKKARLVSKNSTTVTKQNQEDEVFRSTAAVSGSDGHAADKKAKRKCGFSKMSQSDDTLPKSEKSTDPLVPHQSRQVISAEKLVEKNRYTSTQQAVNGKQVTLYSMAEQTHLDGKKKIVYTKQVERDGCVSRTVDDIQKWSDESYMLVPKHKSNQLDQSSSSLSMRRVTAPQSSATGTKLVYSQEAITSRKMSIMKARRIPVEGFSTPVGSTMIPATAFNDIYNGEPSSTSYILTGGEFKCFALKLVRKDNRIVTCMLWNAHKVVHKRENPGAFVIALFCDDDSGAHDCDRYLVTDSRMIKVSSVLNFPLTDTYKQSVSPRFYAKLAYLNDFNDYSD